MALENKLGITGSAEFARAFRPCLINGGMPSGKRFFCRARQKFAGILCVFQEFLTQHGGKSSAAWAFRHFSNKA